MPQPPKLEPGHFVLYSTVRPDVTAGRYVLVSEHTDTPFPVAPEHTHVTVTAPRYVMPPDQIISTFPPANAEGYFSDRLPRSFKEVMACDREAFNRFFHAMLERGVYFAPSAYEAGFVSAAHGPADLEATFAAARDAFALARAG